jgi:hypothetical protein
VIGEGWRVIDGVADVAKTAELKPTNQQSQTNHQSPIPNH